MNYLFDTSILIAGFIASHKHHDRAKPWISKAAQGKLNMYVCNHTLAELYAVLTKLPLTPRISPANALSLIEHNVIKVGHLVNLTGRDYHHILKELANDGMSGGITYDSLIYYAAVKSEIKKLLTLNTQDFERLNKNDRITIISPLSTSTIQ